MRPDLNRVCLGKSLSLVFGMALVLAAACTSDDPPLAKLAEGCLINSDCNAPLVCAFQRCHNACESTRDCPPGLRCVASDGPLHVCQLEEERICLYNSDCPEGQVCCRRSLRRAWRERARTSKDAWSARSPGSSPRRPWWAAPTSWTRPRPPCEARRGALAQCHPIDNDRRASRGERMWCPRGALRKRVPARRPAKLRRG